MSYVFGLAEALSEYSSANYVLGSNGMPPTSWANILYSYFLKNYQGADPKKWRFNESTGKTELTFSLLNRTIDGDEAYHVNVLQAPVSEDRHHGAANAKCEETYLFLIYVKNRKISELFPQIQNIMNEIRRIFIREYISYDLAGIREINHFRSTGMAPPSTVMNPMDSHWLCPCTIKIFYAVNSYFTPTAEDSSFNAHQYHAGQWRKEADRRWALWDNTTFVE